MGCHREEVAMNDPKLLRIVKEIQTRLETINGLDPYFTTIGNQVVRGRRQFNFDELPGTLLTLAPRELDESVENRAAMTASIYIEGYAKRPSENPEDYAIYMITDIAQAIEQRDRSLGELVLNGIAWERDEIYYPDDAGDIVVARVEYSIPHIRWYGDPLR